MFMKHIVMSSGNPMSVKYNSYKVEFAMRGAGHIHGVLWVDWDTFFVKHKEEFNRCKLQVQDVKSALEKIKQDQKLSENEKNALVKYADLFISCSLKNPATRQIITDVNIHHHTKTCHKYDC